MASMRAQVAPPGQRVEGEGLARQRAVAPERRLDRQLLGGDVAPHDLVVGRRQHGAVAAADAVGVDDADRLEHRVGGQADALARVRDVHRRLERVSPVSMASIMGEGSSPDCQVCRSLVPASQASTSATYSRLVRLPPRRSG